MILKKPDFWMDDDEKDETKNSINHTFIERPEKLSGNYGCMVTFEKGETENKVRYKLKINFTKKQNGNNIFKIDREEKIYINDLPPDSILDQLAYEASKAMYPLELEVLNNGSIIDILNIEQIKARWVDEEKRIREYHKGEFADKYLKLNGKTINNKATFIHKLSKDWFLFLYFKLFNKYSFTEEYMHFPTAGKALPVRYRVSHSTEDRKEAKDILIRIKGNIADERCALDLEQEADYPYYKSMNENEKDLEGTCNITYSLNNKTRIIEGIDAEFDTAYREQKKIFVKMFFLNEDTAEKVSFIVE